MSTKIKFEHEAQVKEETYKVGDWFYNPTQDTLGHIARVSSDRVAFISAQSGNRQMEPVSVTDDRNITKEELRGILGSAHAVCVRVSVEITTKPYQP